MHYDPLLAKAITCGATREEALERMREALAEFTIQGVAHNVEFLAALVEHPRFRAGALSTDFISEEFPHGFDPSSTPYEDPALLVAIAASIHRRHSERAAQISGQLPGCERRVQDRWVVVMAGRSHPVAVRSTADGHVVDVGDRQFQIASEWQFGQARYRALVNGTAICLQLERRDLVYRLSHRGFRADVLVLTERAAELLSAIPAKPAEVQSRLLRSPMPGLLSELLVEVGQEVKVGQQVAIVEAMKMENVLCAQCDGRIIKVMARVGETLAVEQPILEFE
jgi:propionyl-CoA carboxylase alpha chain